MEIGMVNSNTGIFILIGLSLYQSYSYVKHVGDTQLIWIINGFRCKDL